MKEIRKRFSPKSLGLEEELIFDVRETKASDYYLTITESKKFTNDDGTFYYKKHKIFLYKEDFSEFKDILGEMLEFIIKERGEEVISERHQKDYDKKKDFNIAHSSNNDFSILILRTYNFNPQF